MQMLAAENLEVQKKVQIKFDKVVGCEEDWLSVKEKL
jgi:hypothetical protein